MHGRLFEFSSLHVYTPVYAVVATHFLTGTEHVFCAVLDNVFCMYFNSRLHFSLYVDSLIASLIINKAISAACNETCESGMTCEVMEEVAVCVTVNPQSESDDDISDGAIAGKLLSSSKGCES